MDNFEQLAADVRKLQLQFADVSNDVSDLSAQSLAATASSAVPTVPPTVQSANQLQNGDLSHSERTWNETTYTDDDENKECYGFFSHDAPAAGQQLYANTSRTGGAPNRALKNTTHSAYDFSYSDWDRPHGTGRLAGTKTIDAPYPQNLAGAGKTEYLVLIAAKLNQYIQIPDSVRMFGGIWDNTAGQRNYLKSSLPFTLTGAVVGTPAAVTERRYKIFARTDRGYSYLSTELVLSGAPTDAAFVPNSRYVSLKWDAIPGVLVYEIYRYTPAASAYVLLFEVTNGATSYNDQNSFEKTAAGYPAATDNYEKAYFATRAGELGLLATDGVSSQWSTIELPVTVPKNYNQSLTTDRQWARLGLTGAVNLQIPDITADGTTHLASSLGLFVSQHQTLAVTLTNGTATFTGTISTVTDSNNIVINAAPGFSGTNLILTITGGGFHGVLVDLIHSSYASGSVYAPNANDYSRTLQPAATPNGSSQGGVGVGGDSSPAGGDGAGAGGGIRCLWENERVETIAGIGRMGKLAKDCVIGEALASGNLQPNYITNITEGFAEIVEIETANGWAKRCSDSHRVITSGYDANGTMVKRLKAGDYVLTDTNGKIERSKLKSKIYTGEIERVLYFTLSPGRIFMSGTYHPSFWRRIINKLLRRATSGGILDHNIKYEDGNIN